MPGKRLAACEMVLMPGGKKASLKPDLHLVEAQRMDLQGGKKGVVTLKSLDILVGEAFVQGW